jgi:hypothetical protein
MMRRYGAAERWLVRRHGRARLVDHVPTISAVLLALQCLLLVPAARSAVMMVDILLVLLALGVLSSTTPFRLWPAVIAFGVTALWEWHVGWWTAPGEPA